MALVTLDEAKVYLRVDSSDEDDMINSLLVSAGQYCADVAKLSYEKWQIINGEAEDTDGVFDEGTLAERQAILKEAIKYAVGYFYEHREEADYTDLMLTLRSLLFAMREEEGLF